LQALDRSPTTLRTYATSLKLWLQFLGGLNLSVLEAKVEHVSRFVAWLRAPAENVTVLAGGTGRCCPATVNKHLAALFSFYDYQARNGVPLAQSLVAWRRVNRGGYRPFPASRDRRAGCGDPAVAVAAGTSAAAHAVRRADPRRDRGM
jgi:hypothetical protein